LQNIDIRFNATSNFGQVQAQMAALQGQAEALSSSFEMMGKANPAKELVNPTKWRVATNAIETASKAYRDAASSSGLLTSQQIRANSETKRYNELLQKQKLSFRDMMKHHGIMKEVYRDQLRMQRMTSQYWGTDAQGRSVFDVTMPANVPKELDNWKNRIGFVSQALESAGHNMINFGKNTQWAGRQLMVGFTVPTVMFGAMTGKMAYDIDAAWTRVAKVYDTTATTAMGREKELSDLREQSLTMATRLAKEYGSAIQDTLEVQQQLAAQGFKGEDLLAMVDQVQRISALGDLDVETAVNMTTGLRTAFKDTIKDANDLTEAFDYMNATENATSLSIQDIAEMVPRAGAALAGLGVNIKEATTLMVAMRSAGVLAPEGANALKSISARILNPEILNRAGKFFEGYANLQQISRNSGGNLYKFIQELGPLLKEMPNYERQQGLSQLFGTWQSSRGAAIIKNMTDAYMDLDNTANQTAVSIKLANQEAEKSATIAATELQRKMGSASGQFKSTMEVLKAELADVGEPFLEVGTDILEVVTMIAKAFNSLSDGKKEFLAYAAIATAVIGPMIMLTGLFFNLFGHFQKGIGWLGTLATRWKGTTVEEQNAAIITEQLNAQLKKQETQMSTLQMELKALAAAYDEATLSANGLLTAAQHMASPATVAGQKTPFNPNAIDISNIPGSGTSNVVLPVTPAPMTSKAAKDIINNAENAIGAAMTVRKPKFDVFGRMVGYTEHDQIIYGVKDSLGRVNRYIDSEGRKATKKGNRIPFGNLSVFGFGKGSKSTLAPVDPDYDGTAQMTGAVTAAQRFEQIQKSSTEQSARFAANKVASAKAAQDLADSEAMAAKNSQRLERAAAGASVAFAGMAFTSGKVQDALFMAGSGFSVLQGVGMLKDSGFGSKWSAKAAASTSRVGKGLNMLISKAKLLGSALLGPWGVVAAVAGVAIYKIYKQMQEGEERQERINDSADSWREQLGLVERKYKDISLAIAGIDKSTAEVSRIEELAERLEGDKNLSAVAKSISDARSEGDNTKETTLALTQYVTLTRQLSGNAEDAEMALTALFTNAGYSMAEAIEKARALREQVESMGDTKLLSKNISDMFFQAASDDPRQFDERLKGMVDQFKTSFDSLSTWGQRNKFLIQMQAEIDGKSTEAWMNTFSDQTRDMMQDNGIDMDKMRELMEYWNSLRSTDTMDSFAKNLADQGLPASDIMSQKFGIDPATMRAMVGEMGLYAEGLQKSLALEQALVQATADELGVKKEIGSWDELRKTNEYQMAQITTENVQRRVEAFRKQAQEQKASGNEMADQLVKTGQLYWINERLAKVGLPPIKSLNEQINWSLLKQKEAVEANTRAEQRRKSAAAASLSVYRQFASVGGGWVDAQQSNMQAVMGGVSNAIMADLQESQDAASAAMDNSVDAAGAALDKKGDGIAAHFDALAERIEKSFDRRIDAINKEIEAEQKADETRQRIYDNTMKRLNAMVDAENRNIDFNVAIGGGNFDEAAKLYNEGMVSSIQDDIESEMDKASQKSKKRQESMEDRVDRLEKQKDKRLDEVDKAREAAEKSLEIEKQKQQQLGEIQKQGLQQRQEQQRAQLQKELDIIMTYIPRNEEQAKKYLERMSKRYDAFGQAWADGSIKYSDLIDQTMLEQMQKTALSLKSDVDWAAAGYDSALGMIQGMAAAMGMSTTEFRKWMGIQEASKRPTNNGGVNANRTPEQLKAINEGRHDGGMIGGPGSSRTGFTGSTSAHNEAIVRARKGEFMMSKSAVNKYGADFMSRVNDGKYGIGGPSEDFMRGTVGRMAGASAISMLARGFQGATPSKNRATSGATGVEGIIGGSFMQGSGGRHRPVTGGVITNGLHYNNAIDIGVPVGSPLYAVADGRVSASYDIPGYEPRADHGGLGYRSYGRVIAIDHGGFSTLNAHLSQRSVSAGQLIKGGARIGYTGNTGNSSGPHLHFEGHGVSPYAFLRKGGTVKYDNTPAILHEGERVLTKNLTNKLDRGISRIENGDGSGYNIESVTIDLRGAVLRDDIDLENAVKAGIKGAVAEIDKRDTNKGRSRTVKH